MENKPGRLRSLRLWAVFLSLATPTLAQTNPECAIEGVTDANWLLGFNIQIFDIDDGDTFTGSTLNQVITSANIPDDFVTNAGPYVGFRMENGNFIAYLLDAFEYYEEYEYLETLANNLVFPCGTLVVNHVITDTNNHDPVLQSETTIWLATPLSAGAQVPDEIIVRDVDLTTSSITFDVAPNDYFDIVAIDQTVSNSKNYHARLVATRLIQGFNEPLELTVTATDNDRTGDPQRQIEFTLTILADPELSIPPSPVFSQAYYSGSYTAATGLVIPDTVQIIEGYDSNVVVALSGDDSSHFILNDNNGVISLTTNIMSPISVPVPNNALTFTITATREDEPLIRGTTAVFISVPEEPRTVLQFEQSYYSGTIENGQAVIPTPILLADGHGPNVQVSINNQPAEYFTASVSGNVVTITIGTIPNTVLEGNTFLNLVLDASEDDSVSARTVVTLTIVEPEIVNPVFSQAVYSGSYHLTQGLLITEVIHLAQGYDEIVDFHIEGEHALYFQTTITGNEVILSVIDGALPTDVLEDNDNLVFLVVAVKESVSSSAAVHISLPLDLSLLTLQFEQNSYVGTIENGVVNIPVAINLAAGFGTSVAVQVINGNAEYFTANLLGSQVTISPGTIPDDVINSNTFLNLVLEATQDDFVSATTVVTLTIITPDIVIPVFSQAVYRGSYHPADGLSFTDIIQLTAGYDETVDFNIVGENAIYFGAAVSGNAVSISVNSGSLPVNVVEDNENLIFLVTATKDTISTSAAIHISLPIDISSITLQFEEDYYTGTIENGIANIPSTITLADGFGPNVNVAVINGNEYQTYFTATLQGNEITITNENLPDEVLESTPFLNLVLEASEDGFVSATTVITLTVIHEDPVIPVFGQLLYSGSYDQVVGLQFTEVIQLSAGFDESVQFAIEGEHSIYFGAAVSGNAVSISVNSGSLPVNVVEDYENLIFLVTATKDTVSTSAAIHISLPIDISSITLQFEEDYYTGTIENGIANIPSTIRLADGFGPNVNVAVINEYFTATLQGNEITITNENLPDEVLESTSFLNIVLEASEDGFVSVTTVITLTVIHEDPVIPVFSQSLYSGNYDQEVGLQFTEVIQLSAGFDETVQFTIEGGNSIYFGAAVSGNAVSISVNSGSLPVNVVEDNENLIFLVTATKDTISTSAAIHISLPIDISSITLQFEEDYYTGTIENGIANIPSTITLADGFGTNVNVAVINEHQTYFTANLQGNEITISNGNLPDEVLESTPFLNLVLEASEEGFVSATTVITLTVIHDDPVIPVFSQSLYSGSYDQVVGLQFTEVIQLSAGFDETVQFAIEGEHSTYFTATTTGNGVTLAVVEGSLPPNVLENNSDLIFLVVAMKGTVSSSAAIHISLPSDTSLLETLQFERNYYIGSIENDQVVLPTPVSLSAGHGPTVNVEIINEHRDYFTTSISGSEISISIGTVPVEVIADNILLNLVLVASEEGFVSATTVVTLTLLTDAPEIVPPVFSQTFYNGIYSSTLGLQFTDIIELSDGFDATVAFSIQGEHSSYFQETVNGNSVTLVVSDGSLPASVVEDYTDLVFLVVAAKGPISSSAAVHISLPADVVLPWTLLRFEQDVYEGAINEGVISSPTISLLEGFSTAVDFNLIGAFNTYFTPQVDGNQVIIVLTAINLPDAVTEEPFINLVLEASGVGFVSTTTVITFSTGTPETPIVRPVFSETFYRGSYEPIGNLDLDDITLSQGYDETVAFSLEGDHSAYFLITNTGSTIVLTVTDGELPEAVLETNNELLFAVVASKSGFISSAAIHISLPITSGTDLIVLRFEHNVYEGAINEGDISSPTISLLNEFNPAVEFNLIGAFNTYFTPQVDGNQVIIALTAINLPDAVSEEPFINLVLEASGVGFVSTTTVITFSTGTPETPIVRPVFSETFYRGSYEPIGNLDLDDITLSQGYDETVAFSLEGDHSAYFLITNTGSTIVLTVTDGELPEAVLETNNELLFAVIASKSGFISSAAIHISLPITSGADLIVLRFEHNVYEGAINEGDISSPTISLLNEFNPAVEFNLIGAFNTYFTPQVDGNQVIIALTAINLPDAVSEEPFINLVLEASGVGFVSTTTVITFSTGTPETPIVRPVFSETFYRGSYEPIGNLDLDDITLSQGYDETVAFSLEGDHSAYFLITNTGSTIVLTVTDGELPEAVLETNNELLFAVIASKSGFISSAAIHISLPITSGADLIVLRFEHNVYEGAINEGDIGSPTISLLNEFNPAVEFNLIGAFNTYFTPQVDGNQVIIALTAINLPDAVTEEPFINLVLEASGVGFVSTTTVITFSTGTPETPIVRPVFSETFYRGSYEPIGNLDLDDITLSQGYDETVAFSLEGDHSAYFLLTNTGSTIVLTVTDGVLPEAVLETNNELLFAVVASKSGFISSAAIHISLPITSGTDLIVLRFEHNVYEGAINEGDISSPTISLLNEFNPAVEFNLIGAFNTYFTPQVDGNQVIIALTAINLPDAVTEEPFINLVLEASGVGFVSTTTVITFSTGTPETPIVRPVFSETFYRGSYEPIGNLDLDDITLSQGYDETVAFSLEGDHSAYFLLTNTGSTIVLTVTDGVLPEAVLETNNELLFAVVASKSGFISSAAIHISLPITSGTDLIVLRFEHNVYEGAINEGDISSPTISLLNEFNPAVEFNLIGAFNTYFTPQVDGNQVIIALTAINLPDAVTEEPFINLVLEASGVGFVSTTTVITFSTGTPETPIVRPVFSETFYRGNYEPIGNLDLDDITLSQGYDETVAFSLEGDHSAYFLLTNTGSTIVLTVTDGVLPEAVLETNNELLFAVVASKSGFISSAAIHISLPITSGTDLIVLRFEHNVYEGAINEGDISSPTISLLNEFNPAVEFNLIGAFNTYFTPQVDGNQVIIALTAINLPDAVTEEPFINLVLEASGVGFVSTTTVITFSTGTPETPIVRPVFSETFYRGSYEPIGNLDLDDITLSQGYDETVAFTLEGDHSAYFLITNTGSTIVLTVTDGELPEPVLETNNELLFAVVASKSGFISSAAIHISLPITSETDLIVLRFEHNVYEGAINEGDISSPTISLLNEFNPAVEFNLIGAFNTYFTPQADGNQVIIALTAINLPDAVTEEPFINLVLEASGVGFVSTTTVITFSTGTPETPIVRPVFSETFYRGSYEPIGNLDLDDITLSQGYDETVAFTLEGDHSAYFLITNTGSTIVLTVTDGELPEPVLETNNELLFAVVASKSGFISSAAIHISLPITSETDLIVLRFEHNVYEGAINEGDISSPTISLLNEFNPAVEFNLIGAFNTYFTPQVDANQVIIALTAINLPDAVTEEPFINLVLEASGVGFVSTTTVITFSTGTPETPIVRPEFSETFYRGSYEPIGNLDLDDITLSQGYDETVTFSLEGDHSAYFLITNTGSTIVLTVTDGELPEAVLETNNELLFAVVASKSGFISSAAIHISLPITSGTDLPSLVFGHKYYAGTIVSNYLTMPNIILEEGFYTATDVQFDIEGEHSDHFAYERNEDVLSITMPIALPAELLTTVVRINLVLRATAVNYNAATTVLTLSVTPPSTPVFSEVIYAGSYNPDTGLILQNEIHLSQGFSVEVLFSLAGDHSRFFTLQVDGNWISLQLTDPITEIIIEANNFLMLSVLASREGTDGGSAAIVITLSSAGSSAEPEIEIPEVTFTSDSYYITVNPQQTGVIGGVFASASNGELLLYTLNTDNEHLRAIVNIGQSNGQVLLMSPGNPGVYQAEVTATTVGTDISATADLTITVETVIVCGEDDYALNPLIILEREEEQAFEDLVTLNIDLTDSCRYEIMNSWPIDQAWFYINANRGLSMRSVDREDPSIAHIHLSQVQIELALICDNDEALATQTNTLRRRARDVESVDFGNREWIITNGITYSRRRTAVNVVITDINDNAPVFVVNGNEPITIGYPDSDALELISPPFFAQVQATDADIGINAHILYSVQDQMFTIHPDTGVIYLMPQAMSTLADGYQFSVQAIDEYGSGHSTSLNIRVRLLSQSQIVTLTIDNAFLESEASVVQTLSQRLNFEIRSLAAVVVPNAASDLSSSYYSTVERIFNWPIQRDTPDSVSPTLTLHVYALDAYREPVDASTLVSSISNLDDDDISWEISSSIFVGSNVAAVDQPSDALLVSTIVLSILVVVLMAVFIGWNIYTIRSNRYKNLSESSSVSSTNSGHPGKRDLPEIVPRSNGDANVGRGIAGSQSGVIFNTITENPLKKESAPKIIPVAPLINIAEERSEVGSSEIMDEDEFGEMQSKRRKSVVTFNELVQQINIEKVPKESDQTTSEWQRL